MLRKLRAWPASSWLHGNRIAAARGAAQELADLAADAAKGPRRRVPDAGAGALPDQLAVLMAEAESAGAPDAAVTIVLHTLADRLGVSTG